MSRFTLHHGDCITVMRALPDNSVDAVVCDPPYGLSKEPDMAEVLRHWLAGDDYQHKGSGFMGKSWDSFVPGPAVWREALRVLKPGGHLLAFFGSRTYDMGTLALRLAGFEIRDQIMWIYGSGFPKSHNGVWGGTALKPAHEPIAMARKPLIGTVSENWQAHGTGALNIEACRITNTGEELRPGAGKTWDAMHKHEGRVSEASADRTYSDEGGTNFAMKPGPRGGSQAGRWPANLIHDGSDEVLAAFPDAKGQQGALTGREPSAKLGAGNCYGEMHRRHAATPRGDTGSAARFFYCAKASRSDRNEGCNALPDQSGGMNSNTSGQHITRRDGWMPDPVKNNHPTVKPTDLMAYLCRLVTPTGGTVLDPFMGSGSTGKGAMREGFAFIGIEIDADYVAIARARISAELRNKTEAAEGSQQLDLLELLHACTGAETEPLERK